MLRSAATPSLDEWHDWRRQGIGGSDAGAICGLSPWKGALGVWLEKTGRLKPDTRDGEKEWLRWGRRLEGVMAEEFQERTGMAVAFNGAMFESDQHPWQRATLDGLVFESLADAQEETVDSRLGVLELKTSNWRSPLSWREGVPRLYQVQVQHELMVTEDEHGWLGVLHDGSRFEIHQIARDDEAISALHEIEAEFWQCVQADTPPPADRRPATEKAIKQAFSASIPEAHVVLDERARARATEYLTLQGRRDDVDRQLSLVRSELMLAMGKAEVALDEWGRVVATWKSYVVRTIDDVMLRTNHPHIAKACETPVVRRRFLVPSKEERGDGAN